MQLTGSGGEEGDELERDSAVEKNQAIKIRLEELRKQTIWASKRSAKENERRYDSSGEYSRGELFFEIKNWF